MIFPCEEDDPVRPHFEESGEEFRDRELECEEQEAREPCVLRDLGAHTGSEVDQPTAALCTHFSFSPMVMMEPNHAHTFTLEENAPAAQDRTAKTCVRPSPCQTDSLRAAESASMFLRRANCRGWTKEQIVKID